MKPADRPARPISTRLAKQGALPLGIEPRQIVKVGVDQAGRQVLGGLHHHRVRCQRRGVDGRLIAFVRQAQVGRVVLRLKSGLHGRRGHVHRQRLAAARAFACLSRRARPVCGGFRRRQCSGVGSGFGWRRCMLGGGHGNPWSRGAPPWAIAGPECRTAGRTQRYRACSSCALFILPPPYTARCVAPLRSCANVRPAAPRCDRSPPRRLADRSLVAINNLQTPDLTLVHHLGIRSVSCRRTAVSALAHLG